MNQPTPNTDDQPRICDYEESDYRTRFWEGQGRDYEDRVEREVLCRLLPTKGKRLLEIGAGFGRLSAEYSMYEQVVLLDYSFSQLQYARQQLGDERFLYVAADAYKLPFKPNAFDGATMIRVLHHFERVPQVLTNIRRTLSADALFILEFANKHNLKAMLRYALRRQNWSPYRLDPVEFVALNYDFHPTYIDNALKASGFLIQQRVPVSWLRLGILKRSIPTDLLVRFDAALQQSGWLASPSVFTLNQATGTGSRQVLDNSEDIFACPLTGGELHREGDTLVNDAGVRWAIRDGIYVFKAPSG